MKLRTNLGFDINDWKEYIDEAHAYVQVIRASKGLPPWDFVNRRSCDVAVVEPPIHPRKERTQFGALYGKKRRVKTDALIAAFESGMGIRAAARQVGVAKGTASKLYRALRLVGRESRCACGQGSSHRGWCRERFKHSPKRQSFMVQWKENQRVACYEAPESKFKAAMLAAAHLEFAELWRDLVVEIRRRAYEFHAPSESKQEGRK